MDGLRTSSASALSLFATLLTESLVKSITGFAHLVMSRRMGKSLKNDGNHQAEKFNQSPLAASRKSFYPNNKNLSGAVSKYDFFIFAIIVQFASETSLA